MKSLTGMTMTIAAATLAIASNGWAAAPCCAAKSDVAAALENSRQNLAWEAHNAKGVDKDALRDEEQRVQGMIDALQRGDKVDPAEIDHTLNRTAP